MTFCFLDILRHFGLSEFPAFELSLTLLEAGILLVDHIETAFAAYDLAISTALFNGCSYFHNSFVCVNRAAFPQSVSPITYNGKLFFPLINHMGSSPLPHGHPAGS